MGRFRKAAEGAGLSIESDKTTIAPRKVLIEHAARRPRFSRSIAVGMAVLVVTVFVAFFGLQRDDGGLPQRAGAKHRTRQRIFDSSEPKSKVLQKFLQSTDL